MLAFVKELLAELAGKVAALLDSISNIDEEAEEEIHWEDEPEGAFSSFSTSLWSLDVSDVGIEVDTVDGREVVLTLSCPWILGMEEKLQESWDWLEVDG